MEKGKILIVEDEMIEAYATKSKLEEFGYRVFDIVSSGEAALDKIKDQHPDLILMDIGLKGEMDGITAAEHIHQQFQIPVVFISASTDDQTWKRVLETVHYGFLLKPFVEAELLVVVQRALSNYRINETHDFVQAKDLSDWQS